MATVSIKQSTMVWGMKERIDWMESNIFLSGFDLCSKRGGESLSRLWSKESPKKVHLL